MHLRQQQRAMTSPEERLELQNQGIPWRPAEAATALEVLLPSVTRTLAALERRRLVFCWATGEGRGRRVSHIKLTWAAEACAEAQERWGMSAYQRERKVAENWRLAREAEEASWYGQEPEDDQIPDPDEEELARLEEDLAF